MTPERWRKIEEIFQTVVEHPPTRRQEMLTQYCGGDADLRREIEALLAEDETDNFLQAPIRDVARTLPVQADDGFIGRHIGPYHVTKLLGQGGMGAVYLAERADDEYYRQVALKVVRRGMDSRFVLKRFRVERQILATLEHPNIAQLLDGGTTEDSLPYFVMEYVKGEPLTEYCDARELSIAERLRLFLPVCNAVQHAHQKLIVHRDLKPSNILVTVEGVPKLLDFGIAKLLDPSLSPVAVTRTMTGMRMMTPDYASPEQVRGLPITTASDIYSLGAVLYELLTGERPHNFETYTPAEIERVICETAIERPSAAAGRTMGPTAKLHKQLTGDLDNIVLMALRKEPERRYQSVEQLAEDIRRYLDGRPISARRESAVYRTGKFIRRNKLGVAAALLVLFSLIGALIVSNYQTRRAERRFQQVRKLANTFLFDFYKEIEALPGSTKARELAVKTALEYLDSLSQDSAGDAALQLELAQAYSRVGDVQGDPWQPNLGQSAAAMQSYRKGFNLAQRVLDKDRANPKVRSEWLAILFRIGALQAESGDKPGAQATLKQGVQPAEDLALQTQDRKDLSTAANILGRLGNTQLDTGDAAGALESYIRSLRLMEKAAEWYPDDRSRYSLGICHADIGEAKAALGDLPGGIESYLKAAELNAALVEKNPNQLFYRRNLRVNYSWVGILSGNPRGFNQGDTATALEYYHKALEQTRYLVAAEPKDVLFRFDLSKDYGRFGDVYAVTDPPQSLSYYRQAVQVISQVLATAPQEFRYRGRHAEYLTQLALQSCKLGQPSDCQTAQTQLQQALDTLQALATQDPADLQVQGNQQEAWQALAAVRLRLGDRAGALNAYQQALAIAQKSLTASPRDLSVQQRLAEAYQSLGDHYAQLGEDSKTQAAERLAHWREARDWRQKSLSVWQQWNQQSKPNSFGPARQDRAARAIAQSDVAMAKLTASLPH